MAFSRLAGQDASATGTTTPCTISYPGATTAGNLLVCVFQASVSSTSAWTPTGWTLGTSIYARTSGVSVRIFYKIADGTEAAVSPSLGAGYLWELNLYEYSGNTIWQVADQTYYASGASLVAGTTFNNTITDSENELLITCAGLGTNVTSPVWTGATARYSGSRLLTADNTYTSSGAKTASVAWTTSANVATAGITFRQDPGRAYTWLQAPAPGNITVTPIAGGTLTDGTTYYYKGFGAAWTAGQYYWNRAWLTEPTAEVSGTADATNKTMHIYMDATTETVKSQAAGSYGVDRTLVSGNYCTKDSAGVTRNVGCPVTGYNQNLYYTVPISTAGVACRTLTFSGAVAGLTITETLTQATSGATAIVATDPAGGTTCKVRSITGTWNTAGGYAITGSVTGLLAVTCSSIPTTTTGVVLLDTGVASGTLPTVAKPHFPNGLPTVEFKEGRGDKVEPYTFHHLYWWMLDNSYDTWVEAINAYEDGDWMENMNGTYRDVPWALKFKCNIINSNDIVAPTEWGLSGNTIIMRWHAKFYFGYSWGAVTFQQGKIDAYGRTNWGGVMAGIGHYAHYNGMWNLKHYASFTGSQFLPWDIDISNPYGGSSSSNSLGNADDYWQYLTGSVVDIRDSVYKNAGRYNTYTLNMANSRIISPGAEYSTYSPSQTAMVMDNARVEDYLSNGTYCGEVWHEGENHVYNSASAQTYRPLVGVTATTGVGTCFYLVTDPRYANDSPVMYGAFSSGANADFIVVEDTRQYITVKDKNNNAIEGATITLTDKNGLTQLITRPTTTIFTDQKNTTKTATTFTFWSSYGTPTVGAKYRIGNERITVDSLVSGTTYNVTRAVDGTSANNADGGNNGSSTYLPRSSLRLHLVNNSLTTDANGQILTFPCVRHWTAYDKTATLNFSSSKVDLNPYTLTVSKSGYKPLIKTISIKPTMGTGYGSPVPIEVVLETEDSINLSRQINGSMFQQ